MKILPCFKFVPGIGFCLAAAGALLGFASGAYAQDPSPLYEYNFNTGDGTNTGTGGGGTLTANVGGSATTGTFLSAGVSGNLGDYALNVQNGNDYYYGSEVGNAASVGGLNLAGMTQFTITMWINRADVGNGDTFLTLDGSGGVSTTSTTSNGVSMGFYPNWNNSGNGLNVGVNGHISGASNVFPSLSGTNTPTYANNWVFVAFAYDGNGSNIYYDPTMGNLYEGGTNNGLNAAILVGGTGTVASVAGTLSMSTGDYSTSPGVPLVNGTSTLFLGNDPAGDAGFSGSLDDVRIYNSLLTISQIDDVQAQGLAGVPEPSVGLCLAGGAGILVLLRRRCRHAKI